jgi:Flp pilus assembly protein TadG
MRRLRVADHSRGQAFTEVALVLPILLVLLMGTIDVARLLFASVAVEEATQEGALFAAFSPTSFIPIRDRINTSSDTDEVVDATVSVSCSLSPAPGSVTVTTQVNYPLITPIVSAMLGGTVQLSATVVAPNLAGAC